MELNYLLTVSPKPLVDCANPSASANLFRMPTNIEIKSRVTDPDRMRRSIEAASGGEVATLEQKDTFFDCAHGRLKLREFGRESGELIFYSRPERAGIKQSEYLIVETADPAKLLAVLTAALNVVGVVIKRRELFMVGQTRVHLDAVDGLGTFVELEVVLREGQSPDEGRRIARDLMQALQIKDDELIEGSYADLLDGRIGNEDHQ